jgi:hypothetical protein
MMSGGVDFTLWPICKAFGEISIQELEICTLQASYAFVAATECARFQSF